VNKSDLTVSNYI